MFFPVSLVRKYVLAPNHVLSKLPKVIPENILQVDIQHLWNKSF